MAIKRARESQSDSPVQPKKRYKVNTDLAKIWEQLADESEDVRLEAAFELLANHLSTDDIENARSVAKRLLRGLCSGRKGARLGFYVALVGALSMKTGLLGSQDFHFSEILCILETQTTPESGTSGQDERDHNFGRLMGCKAILDSKVLFDLEKGNDVDCDRFLKVFCNLMAEKPWLRSECTSILVSTIQTIAKDNLSDKSNKRKTIANLLNRMKEHKLLRTIDGVCLWLIAKDSFPEIQLPRDIWTNNDPLSLKDIQNLRRVLLDTKSKVTDDEEVLGDSKWSPTLHIAWKSILEHVSQSKSKGRVFFSQFWQEVVENGLFNPSSTPERKHTGLLVFQAALEQVGEDDIPTCFSPNVVATLIHSLMNRNGTYLSNTARTMVSRILTQRASLDNSSGHQIILGLITGSKYIDFDVVTKTTVLNDLFRATGIDQSKSIGQLIKWVEAPPSNGDKETEAELLRKNLLNICQRAICQALRMTADGNDTIIRSQQQDQISKTMRQLLIMKYAAVSGQLTLPFKELTIDFLRDKVNSIMEVLLTTGAHNHDLFLNLPLILKDLQFHAETEIKNTVTKAWSLFAQMERGSSRHNRERTNETISGSKSHHKTQPTTREGLALLFALLLPDVYDGDANTTEILEDVVSAAEEFARDGDSAIAADHIIEVILSLVSRSSKLFRRAGSLIFEAFSKHVSSDGLQSLCDIVTSKEGREGQQELFDTDTGDFDESQEEDDNDGTNDDVNGFTELDSDVEVIDETSEDERGSIESEELETESDAPSGTGSSEGSEADNEEADAELTSFENALAKALGTRKLNQDDLIEMKDEAEDSETSDGDADMSDSEMAELDEKLGELFRNQQSQASAQRLRKEEMKSAKDNVINLKNRAIDLIELFLRWEQKRGMECIQLLMALFQMAVMTNTQQLENRGAEIILIFSQRCKGSKLPEVAQDNETRARLRTDMTLMHTALLNHELSNALIEASASFNVLFCRLLIEAGQYHLKGFVEGVSNSRRLGKHSQRQAYAKFWTQYDSWLGAHERAATSDPISASVRNLKEDGTNRKETQGSTSTKKQKLKKAQSKTD